MLTYARLHGSCSRPSAAETTVTIVLWYLSQCDTSDPCAVPMRLVGVSAAGPPCAIKRQNLDIGLARQPAHGDGRFQATSALRLGCRRAMHHLELCPMRVAMAVFQAHCMLQFAAS
mmetsp:Transcript_6766/g.20532  ORF Transcript_6766/g.20532 Transcript_6766/m.20532 type:complete len:116 (-) Transcript_6766:814-1161(-)